MNKLITFISLWLFSISAIAQYEYSSWDVDTGSVPPVDTSYSPEFQDWYDLAVDSGFTLPPYLQRRTLDTMMRVLVDNNILDSLDRASLYANRGSLGWGKINIVNPSTFYATENSLLFVPDSGFVTNGSSTSHMNTSFTPSVDASKMRVDNVMICWYSLTNTGASSGVDMGNIDNPSSRIYARSNYVGNVFRGDVTSGSNKINGGSSTTRKGLYVFERRNTTLNVWQDGVKSFTTTTAVGSGLPTGEMYVAGAKNGANVLSRSPETYAFSAQGAALSDEQYEILDSIVRHTVRRLDLVSGDPVSPPIPPVFASSFLMSDENIASTSNPWKGEEYNVTEEGKITLQGLEAALSADDFIIEGLYYKERTDTTEGKYLAFDIPSMRDGWMFPVPLYYWFKQKVTIDSLWVYNWVTLDSGDYNARWYKFYGFRDSSDFGNPIPLTDNVYTTDSDSFLKIKSKDDTSQFYAVMVEYNKLDRNGLYGTIRMESALNFQLKLVDSVLGGSVNQYPDLPNNIKPFGEIAGVNGFRTDQEDGLHDSGFDVTDSLFTTFKPYRYFMDMSDHTEEYDSGGFAFEPSLYFSGGLFDSDTTDDWGLEIYTMGQAEAYTVTANIKRAYDAGARDILVCFQKSDGSIHYLDTSTVGSPSDGYQNWSGGATHSDKFVVIGDDPVLDWNSISRSKGISDFNFGERYDLRKSWYEGFKNPDYHQPEWDEFRTATGRPTWLLGGSVVGDTMIGYRDSKNWAKTGIAANQKIFNPDERDSVYKSPESWRYAGEFVYAFACYVGGGNCTWEDLKPFMVPLQDSTNLNLDLDVIVAMENEWDKYWDNGQAWYSPMMGGMLLNVVYDGACGTVQDRFGGYRVGIRAADTTDDGVRMSAISSYLGNGDHPRLTLMWAQWFRDKYYAQQQSDQGVENPRHPHTGALLDKKFDRLVFEIHDYPGKIDQSTKVKPKYYNDEIQYMAIPPEDLDHESVMGDFARWAKYNYPNSEIALSEWAYGANNGATFSVNHEDIGSTWTGDSIPVTSGGDTVSWRYIYELPEGYQIRPICEILNWRMLMSPTFTKFCDISYRYETRDYATASLSGNTDSTWANQRGGSQYSKFSFMGFLIRNYRAHTGTAVRMNIAEVMNDYVFDEYVRQDSIWQVRYRHKNDTSKIYDIVYLPVINTNTITESVSLLSGATNVQKVEVYTGTYTPEITDITNSEIINMEWSMKPIIIKYEI